MAGGRKKLADGDKDYQKALENPQKLTSDAEFSESFSAFLKSLHGAIVERFEKADPTGLNAVSPLLLNLSADISYEITPKEQILVYAYAKSAPTHRELSKMTGFSVTQIQDILQLPRVKRAILLLQHAAGLTDIIESFRKFCPRALEVMLEIMNDTSAPASTRLEAAKSVIERIHGKPTAHIEANGNLLSNLFERLDKTYSSEAESISAALTATDEDGDPTLN